MRDEFREICEWLCECEWDGLESADRRNGACRIGGVQPIGLGVTVSIGWTVPAGKKANPNGDPPAC